MADQMQVKQFSGSPAVRAELERDFFPEAATQEQKRLLDQVEERLAEQWRAGYSMAELVGETPWSNSACLGYVIKAARSLTLSEDQIKKLVWEINSIFSMMSIEDAKKIYMDSPY